MFIDSHAHLTSSSVIDHVEEMLQRAQQKGIGAVVNICLDMESLERGLLLSLRHPWVFNAAATHPHDAEKDGFFPVVEKLAAAGKLVALGETGLDYYYKHSSVEKQKESLIRYFALAVETKLPVIIHCREAFSDLLEVADAHYAGPAILHCFTGTMEEVKECLKRGWMVSMSGIVTYKKSSALREVAAYVPLDRLLIETDTPFLAPQSKRGKTNEPSFVTEVAEEIARVKGIGVEEVAEATSKNAAQFFSFPKQIVSV